MKDYGWNSKRTKAKFRAKQDFEEERKIEYPKQNTMSNCSSTHQILYNVTGYIPKHCLCATVGSSGAGKTTFLGIIAGIAKSGTVTGTVGVCSKKIAFVSQVM